LRRHIWKWSIRWSKWSRDDFESGVLLVLLVFLVFLVFLVLKEDEGGFCFLLFFTATEGLR
jgi:hypothetical protein